MITINRQGVKSVDTGRNIDNAAEGLIQTGPKDNLIAADAYNAPKSSNGSSSNNTSSGDCSGGDCGCEDCGGNSTSASNRGSSTDNGVIRNSDGSIVDNREPSALSEVGSSLWDSIVCGTLFDGFTNNLGIDLTSSSLFLRNTNCTAEDIAGLLALDQGSVTFDRKVLEERAYNALGSSLSSLSEKDQQGIINKLTSVSTFEQGKLKFSVGGAETDIANGNYSDASSTMNVLRSISGNDDVGTLLDSQAEFAVLDTMLERSMELGVPGAIDQVDGKIQDDRMATRLYVGRARQAAFNSDLYTLGRIIDLTSPEQVINRNPSIVRDILFNYRLEKGLTDTQRTAKRDELIALLGRLDKQWSTDTRGSLNVLRLNVLGQASPDAKRLLKSVENLEVGILISDQYPSVNAYRTIRNYHPKIPLGQI